MAVQAGLCLAWSETPEDMFCRVVAHMEYLKHRIKSKVEARGTIEPAYEIMVLIT